MINIVRSQPAPESLENEKKKKSGTCRQEDIIRRLKEDFYDKCYICEYNGLFSINIEHIRPHEGDDDKKFDWNNLAWSCGHCNSIKGTKYKKMWDCTDPDVNIEGKIACRIKVSTQTGTTLKEKIEVEILEKSPSSTQTRNLLIAIYFGETILKKLESSKLRAAVQTEIKEFNTLLKNYENSKKRKEYFLEKIKKHLHPRSNFSGFKRRIVMDNKQLTKDFGTYLAQG